MEYKLTPEYDWFSANIPIWERVLVPYFKDKPINAIELGSFEGRASSWLLDNVLTHKESTIDCVDLWPEESKMLLAGKAVKMPWKEIRANCEYNLSLHGEKARIHEEDSATYLKYRTKKTDLIYIDAGHKTHEVLVDVVLAHLLLRPGGIIIFDDYLWAQLESHPDTAKPAIDAFIECFARMYQLRSIGYQVILQKNV